MTKGIFQSALYLLSFADATRDDDGDGGGGVDAERAADGDSERAGDAARKQREARFEWETRGVRERLKSNDGDAICNFVGV